MGISLEVLQNPVKFGSEENYPVDLLFGFASPDKDSHVDTIRDLVTFIQNSENLDAAFFARFCMVRLDETVRTEWEGAETEEEPAEEEPAEEEPAKEEVAKGNREYFSSLIEETNRGSDGEAGTTERSEAER